MQTLNVDKPNSAYNIRFKVHLISHVGSANIIY